MANIEFNGAPLTHSEALSLWVATLGFNEALEWLEVATEKEERELLFGRCRATEYGEA